MQDQSVHAAQGLGIIRAIFDDGGITAMRHPETRQARIEMTDAGTSKTFSTLVEVDSVFTYGFRLQRKHTLR